MQEKIVERRKCPRCGVTVSATIEEMDGKPVPEWLRAWGDLRKVGLSCMDKECPAFETWPEVKK